jgi:hypothetical protein
MKQKATFDLLVLTLASLVLNPDCATITRRAEQRIPVTSAPAGATVSVNGVKQGVTPLELRLSREGKINAIRIESPGYNPFEIRLKRQLSGLPVVGNLILGAAGGLVLGSLLYLRPDVSSHEASLIWFLGGAAAAVGLIVLDTSSGAGYALKPAELIVKLTKADGSPLIDTLVVDADALRHIKWIRVHRD